MVDRIIGADGPNSIVRKKLARPFSRGQLSVAAGYFVRGATSSAIVIKSMREQPGYLWSFPRPDHLAVGICAPAAASRLLGSSAHAVASLDPAARARPRRHAHAVCVAHPQCRRPRRDAHGGGRPWMDAGGRCRGAGRSADARRYLLRAPVCAVGGRRPRHRLVGARGQPLRLAGRSRNQARDRARRPPERPVLQPRLLVAPGSRPAGKRRHSGGLRRSGHRRATLPRAAPAPAGNPRMGARRTRNSAAPGPSVWQYQ